MTSIYRVFFPRNLNTFFTKIIHDVKKLKWIKNFEIVRMAYNLYTILKPKIHYFINKIF